MTRFAVPLAAALVATGIVMPTAAHADPIPPGSFTIVNSASFEGPPVSRGAFLTVFTDTAITNEGPINFAFSAPGTFSTPGGVSVETDECAGTLGPVGPNTKLPLLY